MSLGPRKFRMDEFGLIDRFLRPLAGPQGLGLLDDAALWPAKAGRETVLTQDTLVEGVHFPNRQFDHLLARKLMRVNISDLTAKGARPEGYLLSMSLPTSIGVKHWQDFCEGLQQDQSLYGLSLWGGDTTCTPGPITLTMTMIGSVEAGAMLKRSTAQPGDILCVTGTIGDSYLGLQCLQGTKDMGLKQAMCRDVLDRYYLPAPPFTLRQALLRHVRAALDISDGLVADAGHLATVSGVQAVIEFEKIPLSAASRHWLEAQPDWTEGLTRLVCTGDDYQVLMTVPPDNMDALRMSAKKERITLSDIGQIRQGQGVSCLDGSGRPVSIKNPGYRHF